MGYCSQFAFVCPWKLIAPEELPADVGLLYASQNGRRLYTKRKAASRHVEVPETLWRYLLMARTQVAAA